MKKIICIAALWGCTNLVSGQNFNPWPTTGSVGIVTSAPQFGRLEISTPTLGTFDAPALSAINGTNNPRAVISHTTSTSWCDDLGFYSRF